MDSITIPKIPAETVKAARAILGASNFYITAGDRASQLVEGMSFQDRSYRLQESPWFQATLFLITIFQFIEALPDNLAADALRQRVDWKYALHLPHQYPGLKAATFCEFRHWLLAEESRQQNLQNLLLRLFELTNIPCRESANLEANEVILVVCQLSRLARIWEVLNQAMEALATQSPQWLLEIGLPHWYERYNSQHKTLNLNADNHELNSLGQAIGADGIHLLRAVSREGKAELRALHEIQVLENVWHEQFTFSGEDEDWWRKGCCAGCIFPDKVSYPFYDKNHKR